MSSLIVNLNKTEYNASNVPTLTEATEYTLTYTSYEKVNYSIAAAGLLTVTPSWDAKLMRVTASQGVTLNLSAVEISDFDGVTAFMVDLNGATGVIVVNCTACTTTTTGTVEFWA